MAGASMNWGTLPEKVKDFLVRRPGRKYCDTCIQERLGMKWRQQVQLVTATLAVTPCFGREFGPCCICQRAKQVIYADRVTVGAIQGYPAGIGAVPEQHPEQASQA
jgi:hypothetical protein